MPQFADHRSHLNEILDAVLASASPRRLMVKALREYPPRAASAAVIAIGKAAPGMYQGFVEALGRPRDSFMIVPRGLDAPAWARRGSHPVPDEENVRAAESLRRFLSRPTPPGDARGSVLLLSGGASALMAHPVPGLTLADLQAVTTELLASGADIRELNWVRKHLEQLKGGRLAAIAAPGALDVYALSDVIDDDLAIIGSGPAWPDGSTFADALEILNRRAVAAPAARRFLEEGVAGMHPDTPKPGDPVFKTVRSGIIGNNAAAVAGAEAAAARLGFEPSRPPSQLRGEAAIAAALFVRTLPERTGFSTIAGGETTVRIAGATGTGGRNQEFALAAALEIDGRPGVAIAAFATDGVDGPTDAAGAIVTGQTCSLARSLGLDPREFLARHDSFAFFAALDRSGNPHLIRTGPTGTNVNDVALALVY